MTRLTRDGKRKLAPTFTAGGAEVVYATHAAPNLMALMRLKLPDGTPERVHPALVAHQFDPAFSPDGRYHCFALSSTSPQLVLVIQDTVEKKEAMFRPRDARATVRCPSLAPDGSRVIFSVSDGGGIQIASVNLQGQDLRLLTTSVGVNISPAFSPDGKRIAFSSSRDGNYEIYVMDADGGNVRRLTHSPSLDVRPAWSPDGKRIAFTSNRDGNNQIYVMDADGSRVRRLRAPHPERDDFACWHPDGQRLLLVSERGGRSELYLVEASESFPLQ